MRFQYQQEDSETTHVCTIYKNDTLVFGQFRLHEAQSGKTFHPVKPPITPGGSGQYYSTIELRDITHELEEVGVS